MRVTIEMTKTEAFLNKNKASFEKIANKLETGTGGRITTTLTKSENNQFKEAVFGTVLFECSKTALSPREAEIKQVPNGTPANITHVLFEKPVPKYQRASHNVKDLTFYKEIFDYFDSQEEFDEVVSALGEKKMNSQPFSKNDESLDAFLVELYLLQAIDKAGFASRFGSTSRDEKGIKIKFKENSNLGPIDAYDKLDSIQTPMAYVWKMIRYGLDKTPFKQGKFSLPFTPVCTSNANPLPEEVAVKVYSTKMSPERLMIVKQNNIDVPVTVPSKLEKDQLLFSGTVDFMAVFSYLDLPFNVQRDKEGNEITWENVEWKNGDVKELRVEASGKNSKSPAVNSIMRPQFTVTGKYVE